MNRNTDFNPRSPRGERHSPPASYASPTHFNPRSPRGERPAKSPALSLPADFNPRSPRGERPLIRLHIAPTIGFQPTLPARGATYQGKQFSNREFEFQPTLPARGATLNRCSDSRRDRHFNPRSPRGERRTITYCRSILDAISTHAPREGSDRSPGARNSTHSYFNPRSPRGERLQISPSSQKQNSAISPNFASNYNKNCFASLSKAYFPL